MPLLQAIPDLSHSLDAREAAAHKAAHIAAGKEDAEAAKAAAKKAKNLRQKLKKQQAKAASPACNLKMQQLVYSHPRRSISS